MYARSPSAAENGSHPNACDERALPSVLGQLGRQVSCSCRSGPLVIGEERLTERMSPPLAAAASLRGRSMRQVCVCRMGEASISPKAKRGGGVCMAANSAFMRMAAMHAPRRPGPYAYRYRLRSKRDYCAGFRSPDTLALPTHQWRLLAPPSASQRSGAHARPPIPGPPAVASRPPGPSCKPHARTESCRGR